MTGEIAQDDGRDVSSGNTVALSRLEAIFTVALTGVLIAAHVLFLLDAGRLWRDEAVSIGLATRPTIGDIWRDLQTDSFPIGWPIALRMWSAIVGSESDVRLRLLGSALGIGILCTLWAHSRASRSRFPVLSLAFFGLLPPVICYGDSIRGYGLGVLTGLLAAVFFWRAVQRRSFLNWIWPLLFSLLCVHSLFHNAPFLFAICCAATAVLVCQKRLKEVAIPGCIGAICALSLLPYSQTLATAKDWKPIFQYPMTVAWMWSRLVDTFGDVGPISAGLWILVICVCAMLALAAFIPRFHTRMLQADRDLLLFSGITLVVGVTSHISFLWVLSFYMRPWYFLVTLAIVGVSIDGVVSAFSDPRIRMTRLIAANVMAVLCVVPLFTAVREQKTNIDAVASEIDNAGSAGDLIVINSWWSGYSFQRVYRGKATWTTIPPMPFPHAANEIHLERLLRLMSEPNGAIESVLDQARSTLRNGKRLWIVGDLAIPPAGRTVGAMAPYTTASVSKDGDYYYFWTMELGQLLRDHAGSLKQIPVHTSLPVSPFENEALYEIEGWHD